MRCVQKGGEVFSQHISTGRSWIHARTGEAEVKGICRCWLYVGGRVPGASVCLTQSPGHLFFRLQPRGGSGWGPGLAGTTGQRGREVIAPWSLLWKIEACLVCPSSCLWLAWSILPPSPPYPTQRPTGTQEE